MVDGNEAGEGDGQGRNVNIDTLGSSTLDQVAEELPSALTRDVIGHEAHKAHMPLSASTGVLGSHYNGVFLYVQLPFGALQRRWRGILVPRSG